MLDLCRILGTTRFLRQARARRPPTAAQERKNTAAIAKTKNRARRKLPEPRSRSSLGLGYPRNHAVFVNRDIEGPSHACTQRSKRRHRWSPTQEIGWVRSEEILQFDCRGTTIRTKF